MDRGAAGIDATVAALATAGIAQSGMARTPEEAVPPLFTVDGITFAHLSFTYGFNGASLPPGQPWRSNWLSADAVIAQARDARARGAQVVIASLHWGNEGSAAITPEQRTIAEQVTASGQVDLIVGHHVHVLQPIEQVNGRWVVYGMGNILSNLPTPTGRRVAGVDAGRDDRHAVVHPPARRLGRASPARWWCRPGSTRTTAG